MKFDMTEQRQCEGHRKHGILNIYVWVFAIQNIGTFQIHMSHLFDLLFFLDL